MKKMIGMFLTLILVVNLAIPVKAASKEYEIPEFDLTMSIPDGYDVFTRDMQEDDPLLSDYGLSKDDLLEILGSDIYLDAMDFQGDEEVVITMSGDMMLDLNGLGDTALKVFASGLEEEYEKLGMNVFSTDVYHHSQLDFICVYFYIPEEKVYVLQYYTIYDGNALSVTLRSYIGAISDAQEERIRSIVDSITLSSYTPVESQAEETPAFLYTDEDTGTTFMVPAGWMEESTSQGQGSEDVAFSYVSDPGLWISYESRSLEMSDAQSLIANQQQFGEEFCAEIAEELGIPESSVTMKTYNGESFYIMESLRTSEAYGVETTFTLTQAFHIENGWGYLFRFRGKSGDQHYGEFEKMLESASYGDPQNVLQSTANGKSGPSFWDRAIGSFFSGAFAVFIIFIFRKIKNALTGKKAEKPENIEKSEKTVKPEFVYCQSCGKRLPPDSRFCDVCGEKISKRKSDQDYSL